MVALSTPAGKQVVIVKNKLYFGRALSAEAGVSLPETLVALMILMLGTVGVLSLVPLSVNLTSTGLDYSLLTNRARDVSENLLASDWDDPRLSPGVHRDGVGRAHIQATWNVRERLIDQSSPIPPGREGMAGNLKVISITVVARGGTGVGRRDLTVVVMRGRD